MEIVAAKQGFLHRPAQLHLRQETFFRHFIRNYHILSLPLHRFIKGKRFGKKHQYVLYMNKFEFKPKLFLDLKEYDKGKLTADIMAGIIVGIVALPLAIAFGIASGVTPEKGIITAIIAGLAISLFGGSRVQIGGPTGAFIVIIYGIIQQYGETGLLIATILAGIFLILLGVFHLGTIIKYIPYPIVVGFTSGIAVTIFTTQIKDLFGLSITDVPADFIEKWIVYVHHFTTIDWWLRVSVW